MQNAYTGQTAALSPLDFAAPDIAVQQRQLQRQQQLAELLRAQALQPTGGTEMVGGWAIPNSPVKPLEKLAQALMARHVQGQADEQETSLAQSRSQALAQALSGGNGGPDVNRGLILQAFGAPPEVVTAAMLGGKNKTMTVDTGNGTQLVAVPERGTAAPVNLGSFGKVASPDAVLGSGTTLEVAGMRDATDRRGQDMNRDTSLYSTNVGAETSRRGQDMTAKTALDSLNFQSEKASPEHQAAVASAEAQAKALVEKQANASGAGDLIDRAELLLQGVDPATGRPGAAPTGSRLGSWRDSAAGAVGIATPSSLPAQELKVIGGALTSKVPRMQGPQSDKDVQLYREMAGMVGDDTVPVARRLAALKQVRELLTKYDTGSRSAGGYQAPQGAAPSGKAGGVIKWGDMQ